MLVVFPAVEELSVQLDAARRELLEDLHQVRAQPTPVKHVTSHERQSSIRKKAVTESQVAVW